MKIKAFIGAKVKSEGKVEKINLVLEIKDPELIDQIIKKNGINFYTETEMNELKKENGFLSKRNHKLGNDIQKIESWLKLNCDGVYEDMKEALK